MINLPPTPPKTNPPKSAHAAPHPSASLHDASHNQSHENSVFAGGELGKILAFMRYPCLNLPFLPTFRHG